MSLVAPEDMQKKIGGWCRHFEVCHDIIDFDSVCSSLVKSLLAEMEYTILRETNTYHDIDKNKVLKESKLI